MAQEEAAVLEELQARLLVKGAIVSLRLLSLLAEVLVVARMLAAEVPEDQGAARTTVAPDLQVQLGRAMPVVTVSVQDLVEGV